MYSPTRLAAVQAVAAIRPDDYARTRNHLIGAVTGLSPYLTHGVLTLHEVLTEVLDQQPLAVGHKLVYEFGWREFSDMCLALVCGALALGGRRHARSRCQTLVHRCSRS